MEVFVNDVNKKKQWMGIASILLMFSYMGGTLPQYMVVVSIPGFFATYGYCIDTEKRSICEEIKSDFVMFIIPYYVYQVVTLLVRVYLTYLGIESWFYETSITELNLWNMMKNIVVMNSSLNTGMIWILPALFWGAIIKRLLLEFEGKSKKNVSLIIGLCLLVAGYLLRKRGVSSCFMIDYGLIAAFYLVLGKRIGEIFKSIRTNTFQLSFVYIIAVGYIFIAYKFSIIESANLSMIGKICFDVVNVVIWSMIFFAFMNRTRMLRTHFLETIATQTTIVALLYMPIEKVLVSIEVTLNLCDPDVLRYVAPSDGQLSCIVYTAAMIVILTLVNRACSQCKFYRYFIQKGNGSNG